MKREEVSKTLLIIEEVFYVFMFIYGALFLVAFTLSAFKKSPIFGIIVGIICGLGAGIFLYFIIFRLRLICKKETIYEDDLKFIGHLFGGSKPENQSSSVEGVVNNIFIENEIDICNEIIKRDSAFSKDDFFEFVNKLYLLYEESFNRQNGLVIRPFMLDELYFKHRLAINEVSNKDYKERRSWVKVKNIDFCNYKVVDGEEYLTVLVCSKMKRYGLDDAGYVVFGSKDEFVDCRYTLTFVRKYGILSKKFNFDSCVGCGQSIKINDEGVCLHCGNDYATSEYGWILSDVDIKS